MSVHVLLNLLNEVKKSGKMWGLLSIYPFFTASLIDSIAQDHECWILFIIWFDSLRSINNLSVI